VTLALTFTTTQDYPIILELNEAAVPHVNSINEAELIDLHRQAFFFGVARDGDAIAGFLLALAEGKSYRSLNYRWFSEQYDAFVYIDRIVVAPDFARRGVGRQLYQALEQHAAGKTPMLACEVNIQPPNPTSLAFHHSLGFREVGRQDTDGGHKRVSLLRKLLA
jgi:predicted GNAT superfamily acetyltransferase